MGRAAGDDSTGPIEKGTTDLLAAGCGGDIIEGSQQPQTDCYVSGGIVPNLLERGVEETVEIDPRHDDSEDVRRSKEMRRRGARLTHLIKIRLS